MSARSSILFITPGLIGPGRTEATGGLISNFQLCHALASDYEVHILTSDDSLQEGSFTHAGLYYHVYRPVLGTSRISRARKLRCFLRKMLDDHLKDHAAPEVVMATAAAIPLLLDSRFQGCRRVVVARAYEDFGWKAPRGIPLAERIRGEFDLRRRLPGTEKAYGEADWIITNSGHMRDRLSERFDPRRIEVLYPYCDLDPCDLRGVPPARTAGFVNRSAGKNCRLVWQLAKRMPEWTFKVFGPVPNLPALDNLKLVGWESDRMRMYRQASVWLVPSLWPEPFGRVALEARSLGLRVLVSNRGGLPEAVAHEPSAIVQDLNPASWQNALENEHEPIADRQLTAYRSAFSEATHRERVAAIARGILHTPTTHVSKSS